MSAKIAAALVAAQKSLKGVHKSAHNGHHNYDYASSESIYAECRDALFDAGLVVMPSASSIVTIDGAVWLRREYKILHAEGDEMPAEQVWPIVPGNGRPLDKACASAATASLAYFLRDLLLLPRVEKGVDLDDGDDARDHGFDDKPMPPPPKTMAKRSPLTIDQRISGALDSLGITGETVRWHAVARAAGVDPSSDEPLTDDQKKEALADLVKQYRAKHPTNGEATA